MNEKKCAFLRGVNVNGRKIVMSEMCDVFRSAGANEVSSILATGNIVFNSPIDKKTLHSVLKNSISSYYSSEFELFLKDEGDIRSILNGNPFESSKDLHVYVFIANDGTEKELGRQFNDIDPTPQEEGVIANGTFYWQVTKGNTLTSGFSKILGRKDMRDKFTSRNINTIEKVMESMSK
jgi:Uncharacterized protein conserved in bacteria